MTKIAEGVLFIPGQDEMIPDSHTYVVGLPASQDLSLIDPGLVGKGSYKLDALRQMGIDPKSIRRVILTHTHFDHIGCLLEIQKTMPWLEVWIHELEATPLERGDERTVYGMEMFRSMCQTRYGVKSGAFILHAARKLKDRELLELGEMSWEVIHIPGHSMGSIALYHPPKKILIPGDVIYADHSIGRFDLYGSDGGELKRSLLKLSEREVDILLPGHNEVVTKLPAGCIRETLRQWAPYLV